MVIPVSEEDLARVTERREKRFAERRGDEFFGMMKIGGENSNAIVNCFFSSSSSLNMWLLISSLGEGGETCYRRRGNMTVVSFC